ncbi:ExbD/TolR family protein [Succinivibrio faecicola]|uniref:Biopolymer transporter ExbD n=1 Tax=Succinivibrio faecicola TaxID=2820300 RepID=A0ABS7DGE4_9GAMM|nr:biopolymer transporter ExbD [Succinivibrio faecicola]MBW7570369.1 biopolymer transporter ExbD [Succinivibrio faecicola]
MKLPFEEESEPHIDLTSLIDVIFMLLIFFILTMSFTQKALDIELPYSKHSQQVKRESIICISVTRNGEYFYKDKLLSLDEINENLRSDPKLELEVSADANAPFEKVLKLVDLAKELRGGRILISANVPNE